MLPYQYLYPAPFGLLGIRCDTQSVHGIDFLPQAPVLQPIDSLVLNTLIVQLDAYFHLASAPFNIPIQLKGSPHQQKVWAAIQAIPCGQVQQYGQLARQLHSSAQAVGQACGANPLPLIIPCHRVVARQGSGGFARQRDGALLEIKHWLLQHEQQSAD